MAPPQGLLQVAVLIHSSGSHLTLMKRRLQKGGYSHFSPYQHVTPGVGGWGWRRQRRKSIWGRAAIFGSSSNRRLRGSWGWSAISASAYTFYPLGLGRNPSTPRGCPQRTLAASREKASGTTCQFSHPPLAVPVSPLYPASFLPGTQLLGVLDL